MLNIDSATLYQYSQNYSVQMLNAKYKQLHVFQECCLNYQLQIDIKMHVSSETIWVCKICNIPGEHELTSPSS